MRLKLAHVAEIVGWNVLTLRYHIKKGHLPYTYKPYGQDFSLQEVSLIIKYIYDFPSFFVNTFQLSKELNQSYAMLKRWAEDGQIPSYKKLGKILFDRKDIPAIKAYSDAQAFAERQDMSKKAEEHGLLSKVKAAKRLNIPLITFQLWTTNGTLPPPAQKFGQRLCYSIQDLSMLQQILSQRKYQRRGRPRKK